MLTDTVELLWQRGMPRDCRFGHLSWLSGLLGLSGLSGTVGARVGALSGSVVATCRAVEPGLNHHLGVASALCIYDRLD